MKTLIISGSPRKKSFTKDIVSAIIENKTEDVTFIDCYNEKNISPCIHCGYCDNHNGCSIKDDMTQIYKSIDEADIIIIASPMYFHSVTAPLKTVIDRGQIYWNRFLKAGKKSLENKKGVIILCGGSPFFENQFLGADIVLKNYLSTINASLDGYIALSNTDNISDEEFEVTLNKARQLGKELYEK